MTSATIDYPSSRYLRVLLGTYASDFDNDHTATVTTRSAPPDELAAQDATARSASPKHPEYKPVLALPLAHLPPVTALPPSCRPPLTPPPTDSEDEAKRRGSHRVRWSDEEGQTTVGRQTVVDVKGEGGEAKLERWSEFYPFVDIASIAADAALPLAIKLESQDILESTDDNSAGLNENEAESEEDDEIIHYTPIHSSSSTKQPRPIRPLRHATIQSLSHTTPNPIRRPRGIVRPAPILAPADSASETEPILPEPFRRPPTPEAHVRVRRLAEELGGSFPVDAERLRHYADRPEEAEGCDCGGKVEWTDGVGRLVGCVCEIVRDDAEGEKESQETEPVHVFMDHSNVLNSYLASLPYDRLTATKRRSLSIPILSLLFRRGRRIAPNGMHLVASSPLQQDLDQAVRLGWQCNVLKRVPYTLEEEASKKKRSGAGRSGTAAAATNTTTDTASSDSDRPRFPPARVKKMREQAVDELLHLKILQTLLLAPRPGTIVLATGDAAASQYNEHGFVGCVREALKRGWKVELWAFRNGMSRSWVETAKREKWTKEGGFVLWALDNWLDELTELQAK